MSSTESTSSIYYAMSRFLSGTLLSRLSGLGRDIAMAYTFGTSASVAAFLVSIRFAHLLRRILGEGCLQSAFIPLFEEMKKEDPQKAVAFFSALQKSLLGLLTLISLTVMVLLGCALLFFDLSEGNKSIVTYTLLMMPSLIFICLYGLSSSLLQCEGCFFLPGIAPVAFNGLWIVGALLLRSFPPEKAMIFLSLFLIGGSFLQWAVLIPKERSFLPKTNSAVCFQDVKKIIKPLCLGMIGIGSVQINSALDAIFARLASFEGPAYLWYAIRIEQLPLALFGVALSSALLPPLTRAVKAQNFEKASQFYRSAVKASLAVMIPMTISLIISGKVSLQLLYQRGDFSDVSTQGTLLCLWGYALGLLPSVIVIVTAPLYFAFSDYKTPSKVACLSVILNIVLNFIGTILFELGPFWIAISTSLSAFFNAGMLLAALPASISHNLSTHRSIILKTSACTCLYAMLVFCFETFYGPYFNRENFSSRVLLFIFHLSAFSIALGPLWFFELYRDRSQTLNFDRA